MAQRETKISLPELGMIAGTRTALGVGIGLLFADRLTRDQRKAVGLTLFFIGLISTIPLAFEVLGGRRISDDEADEGDTFEKIA